MKGLLVKWLSTTVYTNIAIIDYSNVAMFLNLNELNFSV